MQKIYPSHIIAWQEAFAAEMATNKAYLSELDSLIGDADHGSNMDRGYQKVAALLPELTGLDIGAILKKVGMTLISTVGGAAGPLYGTFFLRAGASSAGKTELLPIELLESLRAGLEGVKGRGRAVIGEKTMVDALEPALEALREEIYSGESLKVGLKRAAAAAEKGMKDTIPMLAKKGRASYLGERSIGHQDPGATSSALLIQTLYTTYSQLNNS
ncbi:MAG: dihydroxyacetone kinase subunit DhaL [Bacteroidota bacterium]